MKAEVDKLDINKLTNVPTSLNNLKTNVDYLAIGKLKTFLVDLKKLSHVVDNEVVKITKFNLLKTNKQKIRKENSWCIYFNSHKSIQHRLAKSREKNVDKKVSDTSVLVTTAVFNTKSWK